MAARRGSRPPSANASMAVTGWLEVECVSCKTPASLPLNATRRPRDTPDLETGSVAKMPLQPQGPLRAGRAHDQADGEAGDHAV
jgi:hypothetical protein